VPRNIINIDHNRVFKITGNPENFITAAAGGFWGLNENYEGMWEKLKEDDLLIFHATGNSSFKITSKPAIIGWARVGFDKGFKDEPNWIQEFSLSEQREVGVKTPKTDHWPYIFAIKDVHFFIPDLTPIDFVTPIQKKTNNEVLAELKYVLSHAVAWSVYNKSLIKGLGKNFPSQGSIGQLTPGEDYLKLLADLVKSESGLGNDRKLLPTVISEQSEFEQDESLLDHYFSSQADKKGMLEHANGYKHKGEHYKDTNGNIRRRITSSVQRGRIAALENFSCQMCDYKESYINSKGKEAWIYDVDHILEKGKGHGEEAQNLWVLCPTCHREKTAGVIEIDPVKKVVKRKGKCVTPKHDYHLGWWDSDK